MSPTNEARADLERGQRAVGSLKSPEQRHAQAQADAVEQSTGARDPFRAKGEPQTAGTGRDALKHLENTLGWVQNAARMLGVDEPSDIRAARAFLKTEAPG